MARTKAFLWLVSAALAPLGACAVDGADADPSGEVQAQVIVGNDRDNPGGSRDTPPVAPHLGGVRQEPPATRDPDVKCYEFRAYASVKQRDAKYSVPAKPDLYVEFGIKAPWTGKQYIKSFRSLIDNKQVLHHWLLYRQMTGTNESIIENANGAHPDGELLYAWAPGTDDAYFDSDVGMEIPGGTYFQLETHYNNATNAPLPDASGVEVCVTSKQPEHVASLSWVGSDRINGTSATGTCTPENTQPIHLIMSFPHMHLKGTHMKVDLTRANGDVEPIHNDPFDFNYQRTYLYDGLVLERGDKLTTTCTYSEPAKFGTGTTQEMCYFFSIAWPAGQLARNNFFTGLHGANTCIDL